MCIDKRHEPQRRNDAKGSKFTDTYVTPKSVTILLRNKFVILKIFLCVFAPWRFIFHQDGILPKN